MRPFADLMRAVGLDDAYDHYLDRIPAVTLATVNMMSLFGLHREPLGALVGHFAAAEIITVPSAVRKAAAMGAARRLRVRLTATIYRATHPRGRTCAGGDDVRRRRSVRRSGSAAAMDAQENTASLTFVGNATTTLRVV